MMHAAKSLGRGFLKKFDVGITRLSRLQLLEERSTAYDDLELLSQMPDAHSARLLRLLGASRSQLRQDLFVLSQLDFKTDGYFVEFGAASGSYLSNTYLLEKQFGWTGIVAEPGIRWHDELRKNRSCNIETDCVWRDSHSTLTFHEADTGEFSTIDEFTKSDGNKHRRAHATTYNVATISLNDLLEKYNAPKKIDYISIDTEGSEFEILSSFDFDKHQFGVITVEHNFSPQREELFNLFTSKGYARKFENLSKFDDWYVLAA
jgi:FkbM family methyltransferase